MRKIWTILGGLAMASFASADDLVLARSMMAEALYELSGHSRVTIDIQGKEAYRGLESPFRVTIALGGATMSGVNTSLFEAAFTRNGYLTHRLAGDGQLLWFWDHEAKTYSSSRYQREDATSAYTDYRHRLLQAIQRRSAGPSTWATHILMDAFGAGTTNVSNLSGNWRPWQPMASTFVTSGGSTATISCSVTTPYPQTFAYWLDNSGSGYRLTGGEGRQSATINGSLREVEWQATITRGALPVDFNSRFVPPAGSRSVSVSSRQAGG